MFGSDSYVDMLDYDGHEILCCCLCRIVAVDDSVRRIVFVLVISCKRR